MERSSYWFQRKSFKRILFVALLVIGILVRMISLGTMPSGVDQDEAMAAYEAYSTATYGMDITGYHNPVYFEAWGNGMNALEIYLMIPFFQLFGMSDLTMRLPQAIIACATLPVFFLLLKRLFDEKTAFIGLFLLVINPWHIMMSRWALESNLAPAFLLFGFYFFVLALEKHPAYYLLSALMYGLSLYTYAVIWTAVPIILVLQILYALITKRARVSWFTSGFVCIVGLFAIPLLLLILVNTQHILEIKTSLFSIPQFGSFRSAELSVQNLTNLKSFSNLFQLLSAQRDGSVRNTFPQFGLYYLFSMPFILIGLVATLQHAIQSLREKRFSFAVFPLIQLFAALITSLLITQINVIRINCLYIPLILFCAVGVRTIFDLNWKVLPRAILALYCVSFLAFTGYYFGEGQAALSDLYRPGTKEAIAYAQKLTDDTIVCRMHGRYSKVLYYTKMPLTTYLDTVVYVDPYYPDPVSFDQFVFESAHETSAKNDVYIIEDDFIAPYAANGYTIAPFGRMAVAYLPEQTTGD